MTFVRLIRARRLERPELNALVDVAGASFECDCVWRRQRLIVELDGRAFHETAAAFERDRARDRRLQAAGWMVVHVTWRQVRDDPATVIADLRLLLERHETRADCRSSPAATSGGTACCDSRSGPLGSVPKGACASSVVGNVSSRACGRRRPHTH